jgi:hypothetical protein
VALILQLLQTLFLTIGQAELGQIPFTPIVVLVVILVIAMRIVPV